MNMESPGKPYDLSERIKVFVLQIFEFVEKLPPNTAARNIKNQLLRSSSSIGANYRAAKWNLTAEANELLNEANEITAIIVSLIKKAKIRRDNNK